MRLFVMVEPEFKNTTSCELIFKELKDNLRKKRIPYKVVDSPLVIPIEKGKTFLLLISTNISLIAKTIVECEAKKIHPIVVSLQLLNSIPIPGIYSSVTPNIEHSMLRIMKFLKNNHKKAPALYGISVESAPDIARQNCFLQKHILPTAEKDVYHNKVGLDKCFEAFAANISNYDCVICTHNYAAIHLINKLKEERFPLENFTVVSYGQSHIASKFYPEIITVYVENKILGKAAVTILEQLQNNSDILHMNLSVKCAINSDSGILSEPITEYSDVFEESGADIFYEDPQIQNMLLVEKLLSVCDASDMVILNSVLNGDSYEKIANNSFLSYSAVKYRVRNMIQLCNCTTKSQFIQFIKRYI